MKSIIASEQSIDRYISEINRYKLLSREEELKLARRYRETGDVDAAHLLVVSNLRFVVKISHEYRGYGLKLLDLIQEGNIGLMLAVKKFEPEKGYRLISYAV
ncbi:MAG: sigma factor, partial [Elusimicrobiota bacterium]